MGSKTVYYTRGFELISRREGSTASYYVYDGGLSVRALTDETGAVTDTQVLDAFGNATDKTGTTENPYGFQGEEQDATGLYYLRARYMDPSTGTFTTMDTYGGSLSDPMSLHKYMFANVNPVMCCDPSGHFSLMEMDAVMAIDKILSAGNIAGMLYIVDAGITDPELEHHDIFGYFGVIGFGMFFAGLSMLLASSVAGLLVLAIIDTILGVSGAIKGVIDFLNGHPLYGGFEIVASVLLIWHGWKNYASARSAAQASSAEDSSRKRYSQQNNESNNDESPVKKRWNRKNTVGSTPRKSSSVGRAVQERMRTNGQLRGYGKETEFLSAKDGKWYPISEADMSHKTDAVTWWNNLGRLYGPLSSQVRAWMNNPNNYYLEYFRYNRSAGAKLARSGIRYLPPAS